MEISFRQEILRKCVHLSSLWMPCVMYFFPKWFDVILFGVLCILNVIVEYAHYKKVPVITPLYGRIFGKMLRGDGTKFRMSGSPPFLAAACMTILLFPKEIAVMAFVCMILADTAAALVGRSLGKHRFPNGKSWEGCAAFFITGCLVMTAGTFVFHFPQKIMLFGVGGVFLAMIAELFNEDLHLDDNFTIPLITGTSLLLFFHI